MNQTSVPRHYGVVSAAEQTALSGLEFVQGLASGSLPLNSMARTLGYDVVEASSGRVVVSAFPNGDHLNPAGTVHGGLAGLLRTAFTLSLRIFMESIRFKPWSWHKDFFGS